MNISSPKSYIGDEFIVSLPNVTFWRGNWISLPDFILIRRCCCSDSLKDEQGPLVRVATDSATVELVVWNQTTSGRLQCE